MNILHIAAGNSNGGAAKGAVLVHEGLLSNGVSSKILFQISSKGMPRESYFISNSIKRKILRFVFTHFDKLPLLFYPSREKHLFSTSYFGFDFRKHPLFKWADIVHLHWVNQGMVSIESIPKINKPLVWTLRDMWLFTGGCHQSFDCTRFEIGCGKCPHLKSQKLNDLSEKIIKRKERSYRNNIAYVSISKWLKETAEASYLFKKNNLKIHTINNGINTKTFFPKDQEEARKSLGLPIDIPIILVGANSIDDPYKGFKYLLEVFKSWNSSHHLCIFGNIDKLVFNTLNISYTLLGYVTDNNKLAEIYSAADLFLAPSIAEAFGKTIIEAQACGTPVVCFDMTGPKDSVLHKITGYKAIPLSAPDLTAGINWVIDSRIKEKNASRIRSFAMEFDSKTVSLKYIELYESIMRDENRDSKF